MKRFIKNKYFLGAICISIIIIIYFSISSAIDNYFFNNKEEYVDNTELEESNLTYEENLEKQQQFLEEEIGLEVEEENAEAENTEEKNNNENEKIYVYITGEVNVPGVVILNKGSRIVDAINAAGGTTSSANVSKINLVFILEDGMKVNIPSNKEVSNNNDFEYITKNSGDGRTNDYNENTSEKSTYKKVEGFSIVNINTATQTELETLPGIGPSLALNIINYRKENGKFSSIEDIKNVSGIGDSKFNKIKSYIKI